jgi:hypothetical protein
MQIEKLLHYKLCNHCETLAAVEINLNRQMIDGEDRDVYHPDGTLAFRITDALRALLREWDDPWRLPGDYSIVSFCSLHCLLAAEQKREGE